MGKSLKTRTVHALSWSLIQQVAVAGLQFALGILLARLLAPKEFGLIAMLSVFLSVAQVLLDGGFASALIQRQNLTELHRCSIFYLNIAAACLLGALLWFTAPAIAVFYHQPLLQPMLRVLILVPVINGFAVVQNTLLVKQLAFKKQTIILTTALVVSGSVSLYLALHGYGVWSLVVQQVLQAAINAVLLWILSHWRPSLIFSGRALREMFSFGSGMLGASMLNMAYDNLFPLLIGKFFSVIDLGYYNRAQGLNSGVSRALGNMANRVTLPVFAGLQDDMVRFRSGLRKAMRISAFLQFPMMVGLAVVAQPMVLLFLTQKWAPSVPYLQLLCFVGILYPIQILQLNVLFALGRSDLFLRIDILKVVLFAVNALLTFSFGIKAMIVGQMVLNVVVFFVAGRYVKTLIDYSPWEQLKEISPYLFCSLLMGLVVLGASAFLPQGNLCQLAFRTALGAVVYMAICRGLGLQAVTELFALTRRQRAPVADPVTPAHVA